MGCGGEEREPVRNLLHFLGFHDWTAWSEPKEEIYYIYPRNGFLGPIDKNNSIKTVEIHQKRKCRVCNRTEDLKL